MGAPCVLLEIYSFSAETLHVTKSSHRVPASPSLYIDVKSISIHHTLTELCPLSAGQRSVVYNTEVVPLAPSWSLIISWISRSLETVNQICIESICSSWEVICNGLVFFLLWIHFSISWLSPLPRTHTSVWSESFIKLYFESDFRSMNVLSLTDPHWSTHLVSHFFLFLAIPLLSWSVLAPE